MVDSSKQTKTGGKNASTGFIPGDYALAVGMPETLPPAGWKWRKLTDIARLESGHTPSRKHSEYWDNGDISWVGIRDATANHGQVIQDTNQHTTQLGIDNSSARILPKNTVCLSRTASVGYVIVMGKPMATSQDFVNWVCSEELNYQFLKYVLLSENRSFLRFASGTTHQTIYFPEVKAFHICIPPLPEQKCIAHILGTLDDKIELNRKMNATLEGMAQALFKSWFVDFDPVIDNALRVGNPIPEPLQQRAETRRKALGERSSSYVNASKDGAGAPSLPDTPLSHLFPATFTHSEDLGWIPEGWETSNFGEAVTIVGGGTPSTKNSDFWDNGIHYWSTPKDFSSLTTKIMLESSRKITDSGLAKLSSGLLPIDSVLMSSRAPIGYMAINKAETAINQGFIGMICDQGLPAEYMIYCTDSRMDDIKGAASGSTFDEISKKTFKSLPMLKPTEGALKAFTQLIQESHNKIHSTLESTTTLTKLRGTLLPKLISGELSLNDAEQLTSNTSS